jgi:hypothetical protein
MLKIVISRNATSDWCLENAGDEAEHVTITGPRIS